MKKNMFPVDARRSILPYDFSHDVHTERLVGFGAEKYRTYLFFVAVNRHGSSLTASTAKPITDSLQEINPMPNITNRQPVNIYVMFLICFLFTISSSKFELL